MNAALKKKKVLRLTGKREERKNTGFIESTRHLEKEKETFHVIEKHFKLLEGQHCLPV